MALGLNKGRAFKGAQGARLRAVWEQADLVSADDTTTGDFVADTTKFAQVIVIEVDDVGTSMVFFCVGAIKLPFVGVARHIEHCEKFAYVCVLMRNMIGGAFEFLFEVVYGFGKALFVV